MLEVSCLALVWELFLAGIFGLGAVWGYLRLVWKSPGPFLVRVVLELWMFSACFWPAQGFGNNARWFRWKFGQTDLHVCLQKHTISIYVCLEGLGFRVVGLFPEGPHIQPLGKLGLGFRVWGLGFGV